jgi:hypothetical protein
MRTQKSIKIVIQLNESYRGFVAQVILLLIVKHFLLDNDK